MTEQTPHESKTQSKNHFKKINTIHIFLGVIVITIALFNVWQLYSASNNNSSTEQKKVDIEYALLIPKDCVQCYDMKVITSKLETMNINIKDKVDIDSASSAGKALIEKYDIARLPALIIKGETKDSPQLSSLLNELGTEKDNTFIITALNPPYIETKTGEIKGLITITLLTKEDCKNCFDIEPLLGLLQQQLSVKEIKKVSYNSPEGEILRSSYNISRVPTLIFDKEAVYHPSITEVWENVGSIEKDGSYVMRNLNPPYFDLTEGKIKGLVLLTVIKDKICTECYDAAAVNKPILRRLGIAFTEKDKNLDITMLEAQGLISKYKITKIPTILLTGDTETYPALPEIWKEVGSIESDKTYIFRKVELFQQPYTDLELKKIIKPELKSNQTASSKSS